MDINRMHLLAALKCYMNRRKVWFTLMQKSGGLDGESEAMGFGIVVLDVRRGLVDLEFSTAEHHWIKIKNFGAEITRSRVKRQKLGRPESLRK